MISGQAGTKIKRPALGAALVAGLLLTAAVFGPDLVLRLCLKHLLPAGVSYARARAGPWPVGRPIVLEGLTLSDGRLGRLSCGRVEISGLRLLNLLLARPGLDLAGRLGLSDLRWESEAWTLTAPTLQVSRLKQPEAETGLPFFELEAADLRAEGSGLPAEPRFQVKNLVLSHSASVLADLSFQASTEAGLWTGEVRRLTLNGFQTAWDRWLRSGGRPLGLIPELLHLQMDSGQLALDGRQALLVKTARPEPRFIFTKFSPEAVSYNYYLELTFTPSALGRADPFWTNLAGLTGEPLDFELTMDLTLDPRDRAAQLRNLSLDGRTLGRLDLAAELSGLGPGGDTTADWLAALFPARLHGLSLSFQDQGLTPGYYAWLAGVAGWDAAEVPARLKEELLFPLVGLLAEEGGLSNLPALAAAAEAFLDQPENLTIAAEPTRPLALARLVKMDRYDIIDSLGMTLTVNDQPPVAIGVASEVPAESRPAAPGAAAGSTKISEPTPRPPAE